MELPFPTEFSSGSIPIFSSDHFSSANNAYPRHFRHVMAVALAALSIIFIGLAYGDGRSGGPRLLDG
jgi:hypothetical protein